PLQQLGQFRRRGRPPQAFRKQALRRSQQAAGDDEGCIVALGLLGLGEHVVHSGRNRVDEAGMEPALAGLVMLDGRDQADRPFLEQVAKGDATRPAGVGGFQHQVEVVLDQDPVRLVAARPLGGQEALLFAVGQPWVARDLRPGVLLLVVYGSLLKALGHLPILRPTGLGAEAMIRSLRGPSGSCSRPASAGLYITEAADIAAMAPATNIGSAHPVSLSGSNPAPSPSASASGSTSNAPDIEMQKVEIDAAAYVRALATLHHRNADWAEKAVRQSVNVPADEAVKLGVVDFESRDLDTLLSDLDGRQVS